MQRRPRTPWTLKRHPAADGLRSAQQRIAASKNARSSEPPSEFAPIARIAGQGLLPALPRGTARPSYYPMPELVACPVIWEPAGDTAYQLAPYATTPSPFVSPGF